MADLILAVDCGSQSVRALAVDLKGHIRAKAQVPLPAYRVPRPGWAEQPPEIFWEALCEAVRSLTANEAIDTDRFACLALTSQRGTVVNLDADGEPLRPAILWQDMRVTEGLPPIGGLWGAAFRVARVKETIDYLQANAESSWLRTHQPEIWKKTHKLVLLSGYLNYKLTGRFVDSVGCQVGYFPFDYKRLDWARRWDWKWAATGIPAEMLVALVPPGETLGSLSPSAAEATGLPRGLAVVATASDKAAEVLGAGSLERHVGCLSYGTSASVAINSQRYLETIPFLPPYPSGVPGCYCPEISLFRGYWMVAWFKREFGAEEVARAGMGADTPEQLLDEAASRVPAGCNGLVLQPFWSPGLKDPGPEARGAVLGFTDQVDRATLYRAVLEGIAYALRAGKERMERRSGVPISSLRVSGGGAQSDVAMQITADVFGLPATRPHTHETSGLGAAIIAAVGSGLHPDYETAVAEMTRTGGSFEPIPANRRLYDALFREVYEKMYGRLQPLYRSLNRILD